MFNLMELASNNTKHLWLKIAETEQKKAWQYSQQHHSNPIARYNSYLNHICLDSFITWLEDWLQEESGPKPSVWPGKDTLPTILEVVNGIAIQLGETRLILLPTETTDLEELSVPQEWVDIPNWIADYYLAVQVNLDDEDECWMAVRGFATHRQLKNEARYNQSDRTYSLAVDELTENFTILLATLGLNFREEVSPLTTLSTDEAQDLLRTLANPSIYSPRLRSDVSFSQWAGLIANEQWRQQLYNQRLGLLQSEVSPVADIVPNKIQVNLSQWFDKVFEIGWQSIDTLINTPQLGNLAFATRSFDASRISGVNGGKLIDLGMQLGEQSVVLLVALTEEAQEKIGVLVQAHPTGNQKYLPPYLKLVLSSSGETLQVVESRTQDYYISLNRFKCLRETSFSIQLILGNFSITEDFVV
ncbi:MAG: DUF1822 family protein [Nostoc sp. DedQUE04]|uniref:DUF1822 family protein n=1 Tax=Nostoc sp. DedQUE04 TaxID=3075390 RepID=UPI002AD41CD3|nr:DUF1822 family protein [Nostoc sp. DedQUE04]MDZ8138096.1 DUF1822 family protein [Nostoc sp. DedQUE04]